MTSARDRLLQHVREAVQAGNRAGAVFDLEARGGVGYQGGGADPVSRFSAECTAAGGQVHVVGDRAQAVAKVIELVRERSIQRALLGRGRFLDTLEIAQSLGALGIEVTAVGSLTPEMAREPLFAADVGISGVDYLVAETGTVVALAALDEPRSLSLLPPFHIAVAERSQLLPDLFDLFALFPSQASDGDGRLALPSCLSLITGPSKTGDIELRLVTGVHGPGEIHVVLFHE